MTEKGRDRILVAILSLAGLAIWPLADAAGAAGLSGFDTCLSVLPPGVAEPAAGLACFDAQEAPPAQEQQGERQKTPEEIQAERNLREKDESLLRRKCAKAVKNYQYKRDEVEAAVRRGESDEVLLKRQRALDYAHIDLCKCLEQFFGAYGELPADLKEYKKICFPTIEDLRDRRTRRKPIESSDPCGAAKEKYRKAVDKWIGAGSPSSGPLEAEVAKAEEELRQCQRAHAPSTPGGDPQPEIQDSGPGVPGEGTGSKRKRKPRSVAPPRGEEGPRDSKDPLDSDRETPGGEGPPRAPKAEGDCEAEKKEWSRLLNEYKAAEPKSADLYRRYLDTFEKYCKCLELFAREEFEKWCQGGPGVPPPDAFGPWRSGFLPTGKITLKFGPVKHLSGSHAGTSNRCLGRHNVVLNATYRNVQGKKFELLIEGDPGPFNCTGVDHSANCENGHDRLELSFSDNGRLERGVLNADLEDSFTVDFRQQGP